MYSSFAAWLGRWGLNHLVSYTTIAIGVAWMLQTSRYHLSVDFVAGNKGEAVVPERAEAYWHLMWNPRAAEDVNLVKLAIYGTSNPGAYSLTFEQRQCEQMTLDQVKRHCRRQDDALSGVVHMDTRMPVGQSPMVLSLDAGKDRGRAIVVDFGAYGGVAAQVAVDLIHAGLVTRSLVHANMQLPNSCGYLAALWACHLRVLGDNFDQFTTQQAQASNTVANIQHSRRTLRRHAWNARDAKHPASIRVTCTRRMYHSVATRSCCSTCV